MIRIPVYRYTVTVAGRPGSPALTFQSLPGSVPAGAVYAPSGAKLAGRRAGVSKLVLHVPRPENPAEFVVMDAADAGAAAGTGSFGLSLNPPAAVPEP